MLDTKSAVSALMAILAGAAFANALLTKRRLKEERIQAKILNDLDKWKRIRETENFLQGFAEKQAAYDKCLKEFQAKMGKKEAEWKRKARKVFTLLAPYATRQKVRKARRIIERM